MRQKYSLHQPCSSDQHAHTYTASDRAEANLHRSTEFEAPEGDVLPQPNNRYKRTEQDVRGHLAYMERMVTPCNAANVCLHEFWEPWAREVIQPHLPLRL